MKIGLVCPYDIAKGGGVQEIVRAMQAELERTGHEAYIITPEPKEPLPASRSRNIIFIGTSADFNSPLHTTVQVSAGVHEAIDTMFAKQQFDLLHFHEPWVPMLSMQLLSRSNCVNVATFHAKLPETLMSRTVARAITPYAKSVLRYVHELTAVSDAAADYLSRLTDRSVSIIPNGIDLSVYKRPRARKDNAKHKKILFVGRLEQRKGVKYLIRAFAHLHKARPETTLLLVGDGPDRRKLEILAANMGVADSVQFLGYVDHQEKVRYLQAADLFCSPALYGESFGIVLLEAMATGLVTVAGDNPGYASVMKGLGAISLINPKHTAEFARRLDLLLHETDLRKLWRDWAQSEVPQYGYPQIVKQYEEVYKTAYERHSGSLL